MPQIWSRRCKDAVTASSGPHTPSAHFKFLTLCKTVGCHVCPCIWFIMSTEVICKSQLTISTCCSSCCSLFLWPCPNSQHIYSSEHDLVWSLASHDSYFQHWFNEVPADTAWKPNIALLQSLLSEQTEVHTHTHTRRLSCHSLRLARWRGRRREESRVDDVVKWTLWCDVGKMEGWGGKGAVMREREKEKQREWHKKKKVYWLSPAPSCLHKLKTRYWLILLANYVAKGIQTIKLHAINIHHFKTPKKAPIFMPCFNSILDSG